MMTVEQAKRFETDGIKVNALHPGVIMGTRFGGGQPKAMQMIAGPLMRAIGFACTLEEAVRRFRLACFDDAIPTGAYVVKGKSAPLPKQANDASVRTRVMALLDHSAAAAAPRTVN
jgi:NAD(P)-dependent dehydrogenase (short-subunit alcohol dehydrogenase family)